VAEVEVLGRRTLRRGIRQEDTDKVADAVTR
jgi:hypothetical protein